MSVVPMKLLTVAGPLDQFDAVVSSCVINQEFHPENALPLMREVGGLRPFDLSNPYTALLRRGEELAEKAGIALEYAPFDAPPGSEEASAYFDSLDKRIEELVQRREEAEHRAEQSRNVAGQLEYLHGITGDLDTLWTMSFVRFRYGYLPRETFDSFQETLNQEEDIFFFPTDVGPRRVYGVYFTTKAAHKKVDTLFNSLHFVRIHIDEQPHGTLEEALADLQGQAVKADLEAEATASDLAKLTEAEREKLLSLCSGLRYQNDSYDVRRYAVHSRDTFYLMGWVPGDAVDDAMKRLAAFPNLSCVMDDAGDVPQATPPTKLKNSFFGRIFRPFLEMYGLPAYNELDPSVFMAVTYCLFFGIMFGDIGQGLGLALIGIILSKWKKMWLGNIIACCGLSGAVFGCVYGSVFGFEDFLPGFKILEDGHVLMLLIASLALGVVMLAFVMILNIVNGVRQRNWEKILFGPNGAAGMVFYLGLIIAAVCTLLLDINLLVPGYILPVLILPLVLILVKEPLSRLLSGDPEWNKVSPADLFGVGFFELFETLLSYLTNTLSFLRIGAYAITHVGLMLVVHMLAELAGGGGGPVSIVILILGNLFVMGFEGLLVCIQVLRLEFYELFGRFYDDGGIPYEPKIIDYSSRSGS